MFFNRFRDRAEAGSRLVNDLMEFKDKSPLILAIPRGGVVVAYEIAEAMNAPLDMIFPRKIGAPGNEELAIGAVTEDGATVLNEKLVAQLNISKEYIDNERGRQIEEIRRRVMTYRGDKLPQKVEGRNVIIVDDGIATGATMRAAIKSVYERGASIVIVAVPVGPQLTIERLKDEVDRIVCPIVPEPFFAIGQFYEDFSQVSDEVVIQLMEKARNGVKY